RTPAAKRTATCRTQNHRRILPVRNRTRCQKITHLIKWTYVCHGTAQDLHFAAAALGAEVLDQSLLTVDEIFVSRVLR
ncbi:MAG: hypothetical protein ACKON9_05275, partial [Planctomycetaceae bacterium]